MRGPLARDPRNPGPPLDESDPRRQARPPDRTNRRRVTKPLQGIGLAAAMPEVRQVTTLRCRLTVGRAAQVGPYQALTVEVKKKILLWAQKMRGGSPPRASIGSEP